ncbi:MAG: thioredoxin domain-containing protein [Bacteroidota bacterium]
MKLLFWPLLLLLFGAMTCQSPGTGHQAEGPYSNHLANESSPYLLQHANNPVDWYPWGEAALEKAEREDKMLLISVGYAACHWCHVMEHESFEDSLVSQVMNENFVCIKVDREERPDIDDVYMTACQLVSQQGCGWPLNAFALPDGRPVWAGTYYPKKEWLKVLESFINLKTNQPERLEESAVALTGGIREQESIQLNLDEANFTAERLDGIYDKFIGEIDLKKGGRRGAPKFPIPNNYQFLLRYAHQNENEQALDAVTTTLDQMARGGIYDQIGGGFARYSTDADWLVPHFEKMLYDNGQLVSLYSEAYLATKRPLYQKTVEQTLAFIERELSDPGGGFYSSLDADSEGEEGKFYVWSTEELAAILPEEQERRAFETYYEVRPGGNWEAGKNILHRRKSSAEVAKKLDLTESQLEALVAEAEAKVMAARDQRIRPGLDDKILTSWNALMLKGYCDAYRAFGQEAYRERALRNARFLLAEMKQKDHRLNRNFKDGKSSINAFLDDYALTIEAFVSLYQITFDESWLQQAEQLAEYARAHFFDAESGMFNYTSDLDPPLVARKKELSDNVIPGSNSSMARALFHLGTFLYRPDYLKTAEQMMKNMDATLSEQERPSFFSNWCQLFQDLVQAPYEIAIVGENWAPIHQELSRHYLPNALLLGGADEGTLELLQDKLQEGMTMIYVCQNKVCKLPVTEVDKALTLLD